MKVKVIKKFVDKHDETLHLAGSVFDCSEDRYKEILLSGFFVDKTPEIKSATEKHDKK